MRGNHLLRRLPDYSAKLLDYIYIDVNIIIEITLVVHQWFAVDITKPSKISRALSKKPMMWGNDNT